MDGNLPPDCHWTKGSRRFFLFQDLSDGFRPISVISDGYWLHADQPCVLFDVTTYGPFQISWIALDPSSPSGTSAKQSLLDLMISF
jgi:hypothetical protein